MCDSGPVVEVRRQDPGTVVVVVGGEHDLDSAPTLQATLEDALADCTHLVVDLCAATFIDSSTVNALVQAKRQADDGSRRFNLVLSTTPIVERTLEICGVLPALNRVKTLEDALAPPIVEV
ncbi:MAG TPA: STAS domain-containing protein [Gaiellaceae bacterium]|nr:STAS domain-containing protein [Gaiellaceae bacterium]